MATLAIMISALALTVSVSNAWLTWFHRGTIRMTAPSMVAFAYDERGEMSRFDAKIMIRALLYSTGAQGHAVETLFLKARHLDSLYSFPVWGLAVQELERGGGLFVGKTGVSAWHHFLPSSTAPEFQFGAGTYNLEVWARLSGRSQAVRLWSHTLRLPAASVPDRHDGSQQVWFDQDPESGAFQPRRESRRKQNT